MAASRADVPGVRPATKDDVGSLVHLASVAGVPSLDEQEVSHLLETGMFLVAEGEAGDLTGALHVRISRGVGIVDHLLLDPAARRVETEVRLTQQGNRLCAALGTRWERGLDPAYGPA